MTYLFFILGFVLIYYGSEWFLNAAQSLAIHLKWSPLLVGILIMGFGTSAPEIAISVYSSLTDHTAIVVGNIVGSNITNVLLVLGIGLLVLKNAKHVYHTHYSNTVVFVVATALLMLGLYQQAFSRGFGLVLLLLAVVSSWWLCKSQKQDPECAEIEAPLSIARAIILLIVGLAALVISVNWIVSGVLSLAKLLGIETSFLAMSVVALGTSLPEVALSITAARRGEIALVMGNVLGSNVSNIFLGIGVPSVLADMQLSEISSQSVMLGLLATSMLFIAALYCRFLHQRWFSALLLIGYFSYYTCYFQGVV